MREKQIGRSGLSTSEIVLGTWQFDNSLWAATDVGKVEATIHAAIDAGITLLDTAEAYGDSEELIGRALKGRRHEIQILTKMNRTAGEVRKTVEQSLRRLQTDYIDIYMAHYPPKARPFHSVLAELDKLRQEGKIRALGVSNFNREQLEESLAVIRFDACESPFNLLWREIELNGVLEFCSENEIALLSYSSMAQGILAGAFLDQEVPNDIHAENKLFKPGFFERSNDVARAVAEVATELHVSAAQVALSWVVSTPGITAAIAGAEEPWQIEDAARAAGVALTPAIVDRLGDLGMEVARDLDYGSNMWSANPEV
jgi:aryl-alcohol dehydrogenase-like predicted oxidoreductase